jgi:hypothetical protein
LYSLSDVEEIADAPRRTVTWWIEQGVILPEPGTHLAGRGVHRQFTAEEIVIACMLRAASQDHIIPIGRLLTISRVVRNMMKSDVAFRRTVNQAISGEVNLFLIVEPTASDGYTKIGFFPVPLEPTAEPPTIQGWKPVAVEKAFYKSTIKDLLADNSRETCSKTIVYVNPWLSKVREPLK